jgi:hypothetical protein
MCHDKLNDPNCVWLLYWLWPQIFVISHKQKIMFWIEQKLLVNKKQKSSLKFSESKFLVIKFEFGMNLEVGELFVTFGMILEGVCHELYTQFHYKLISDLELS